MLLFFNFSLSPQFLSLKQSLILALLFHADISKRVIVDGREFGKMVEINARLSITTNFKLLKKHIAIHKNRILRFKLGREKAKTIHSFTVQKYNLSSSTVIYRALCTEEYSIEYGERLNDDWKYLRAMHLIERGRDKAFQINFSKTDRYTGRY